MVDSTFAQILRCIAEGVSEIDTKCCTLLGGIEHGLVNVKAEFKDRALQQTGKKLTEETIIAWLLRHNLTSANWRVQADEVPYPNDHLKKCDLVADLSDERQLWIELKMAWKAWSNCIGDPIYFNGRYQSYLEGSGRTHSLHHDFEKLSAAALPSEHGRAVCLVGFDHKGKPMDGDVLAIARNIRHPEHRWDLIVEKHWPDRRNADFRINVWCWLLTT